MIYHCKEEKKFSEIAKMVVSALHFPKTRTCTGTHTHTKIKPVYSNLVNFGRNIQIYLQFL